MARAPRKGVVISHIGLKPRGEKPERESPKRIISASGRSGLLQMVSDPDIGLCPSEEVVPQRGRHKAVC